jgi:hypothetical protein
MQATMRRTLIDLSLHSMVAVIIAGPVNLQNGLVWRLAG